MAYNTTNQPNGAWGGWAVFWIIVAAIVVLFIIGYFAWWTPIRPAGAVAPPVPTTNVPPGAPPSTPIHTPDTNSSAPAR